MVPLAEVHDLINREREGYDRLLLTMLQGNSDLKEKEDELLTLREKLHQALADSAEKDRTQANDSKLIMQLSKKLETLLMENEDLRDNNDRLNQRLVTVECKYLLQFHFIYLLMSFLSIDSNHTWDYLIFCIFPMQVKK